MKASIIIVNYNSLPFIKTCLQNLIQHTHQPLEIIIVDNHSTDSSRLFLQEIRDPRIRVILNDQNFGFPKACNQGLYMASGDLLVTMNPDVLVPDHWLTRMSWHFARNNNTLVMGPKGIGIGGPQSPGPIAFSSRLPAADRKFAQKFKQQSEPAKFLIGCLLLFDHHLLSQVGYFDEHLPLGADDFDLSLRVRKAGYELRVARDVLVQHAVHSSFKRSNPEESERLAKESYEYFGQKWRAELQKYGWKRLFEDEFPVFPGEKVFQHT